MTAERLVSVKQYLRPKGRIAWTYAKIPNTAENSKLLDEMKASGAHFAAEILTTREVALYIETEDADLAIEVTSNGPDGNSPADHLVKMLHRAPWRKP